MNSPAQPPKPRKKGGPKPGYKTGPRTAKFLDRIEEALRTGIIDLLDDGDRPADRVEITTTELAILLAVMFAPEFVAPAAKPAPTGSAPGSQARVAEYARRVRERLALFCDGDAKPEGKRGLLIRPRRNGRHSGVVVMGWADEPAKNDEPNGEE